MEKKSLIVKNIEIYKVINNVIHNVDKFFSIIHIRLKTFSKCDIINLIMKDHLKLQEDYLKIIKGEKLEKFTIFQNMLLEYNRRYNLTAITDGNEILYKHFLDSVMGEGLFPEESSVAEVGSGAGFPSVPLKIIREDLSFTLIESTRKKCDFLSAVVDKLDLKGVKILNVRAEDAGRGEETREKFDVCCARAVARLNTLAEYCMPLVKKGGKFIAYKGRAEEEVSEAVKAIRILGGGATKCYTYELKEGMGERCIVTVEKSSLSPIKYPRGNGKERSAPIV